MTKISDINFMSPEEINQHPCITSDRYLHTVPETVTVTQVCQDSYNTSLVILNIVLVGAYLFSPTLKILSVDGDTSYSSNGIIAPFALGHFKNPDLPINTNCSTYHGTLVFDFGRVIPNYINAQTIVFRLEMFGQVPLAYGVSFPNQTCSFTYTWTKGILPQPISLTYEGEQLGVVFEYRGNIDCSCNIQCVAPTGVSYQMNFCPGERQIVTMYQDPNSTDPYNILIQLSDSIGNLSNLEFQGIFNTMPKSPIVSIGYKPKRALVNIFKESANGVPILKESQYQILKYHGSRSNYTIWKDWSDVDWNHFIDYDLIPGEKYGYAVRYKGIFGDISRLSEWVEVTL